MISSVTGGAGPAPYNSINNGHGNPVPYAIIGRPGIMRYGWRQRLHGSADAGPHACKGRASCVPWASTGGTLKNSRASPETTIQCTTGTGTLHPTPFLAALRHYMPLAIPATPTPRLWRRRRPVSRTGACIPAGFPFARASNWRAFFPTRLRTPEDPACGPGCLWIFRPRFPPGR